MFSRMTSFAQCDAVIKGVFPRLPSFNIAFVMHLENDIGIRSIACCAQISISLFDASGESLPLWIRVFDLFSVHRNMNAVAAFSLIGILKSWNIPGHL